MANQTTTDATLTEYLPAADNQDDSTNGAAKITYIYNSTSGLWQADSGEALNQDPDEYRVGCSCGEEFGRWGKATRHVKEQH